MRKCAAVFLCMAFGLATASATDAPAPTTKKAAPTAATAAMTGVKATKTGALARGTSPVSAREAFANPYETPLLLNAKPLAIGRP